MIPPAQTRRFLGGVVLVTSSLALIGWYAGIARFVDWDGDGVAMQPNTALALMAAGLSLLLAATRFGGASVALGVLVAAVGGATLAEHATGLDLGIDQLLVAADWGQLATTAPGRMGLPASLCISLLGLALVLSGAPPASRRRQAAVALGLCVLLVAMLGVTGYLLGADPLHNIPGRTAIALQSAILLAMLGLGVTMAAPEVQPARTFFDDSGPAQFGRRALPLLAGVPILFGMASLRGAQAGYFSPSVGTALLVLLLATVLCGLLWWGVRAVSDRERALAGIAQASIRAHLVLSASRDQFLLVDSGWRFTYVNQRVIDFAGQTPEMLGNVLWELWPDTLGTPVEAALRRAMERREPESLEYYYAAWRQWLDIRIYPAAGGALGVFIVDITERKRAEQLLIEQSRLLEQVAAGRPAAECFASVCEAIGRLDPHSRACVVTTSEERDRLATVTAPQLAAGFVERLQGSRLADPPEGTCGEALLRGQPVTCGDITTDGRWSRAWRDECLAEGILACHSEPVTGSRGETLGSVMICLAEARHATAWELQLAQFATRLARLVIDRDADARARDQANQALVDTNRRKDEFLATLAHELRNPLAPIRNSVELMKRSPGDGALLMRAQRTIERQTSQLVRLIDDLLDVSRINNGKLQLRLEPVDLATIVQEAVDACRLLPEGTGREFRLNLAAAPVLGDAVRLAQVVGNLLTNACKFSDPGSTVQVELQVDGAAANLAVRDQGVGIPAGMENRIFEMFTQVDNSIERSQGGLGIGLTLVQRLVQMHGGTVTARSAGAGQGSEFVIQLPAQAASAPGPSSARPPAVPAAAGPRRWRTLVVDDNADSANSLALLLELGGNDVRTAGDGREAVQMAASWKPEVVLLDIGLPGINGYDACREIRGLPGGSGMRIIALTGWGKADDVRRATDAGFDGHFVKPVDHDVLLQRLASLDEAAGGSPPRAQ